MPVAELNTLVTGEGGHCVPVTVLNTLGCRGRWALCL